VSGIRRQRQFALPSKSFPQSERSVRGCNVGDERFNGDDIQRPVREQQLSAAPSHAEIEVIAVADSGACSARERYAT